MKALKLKGLKSAVSLMKKHAFVRVYMNVSNGCLIPRSYSDCNSWTDFGDNRNIAEVFTYNAYKEEVPTMKELKQEIEERIENLACRPELTLSINN